jgi:hypothetical protein
MKIRTFAFIASLVVLLVIGFSPAPASAQSEAAVVAILKQVWDLIGKSAAQTIAAIASQTTSLGTAIIGAGDKTAAMVEADGNANRSMMVRQSMDDRIQNAADSFSVPDNACANSASGGMLQVAAAAHGGGGNYRSGGVHAGSASVDKAVNSPSVDPTADARRSSTVHIQYCDAEDFASYGGSKLCPSESQMPGGDKRMDSLITGAGPDGKDPDATFNQDEIDAARMYTQNSTDRSIARGLSKGEAATPAGQAYAGLLTQYQSLIDAAGFPQREELADHTPNQATQSLLNDSLQDPSAQAYFAATASKYAQANKVMSYAELEQFEVGRRYANPNYEQDLATMSGDNLTRELVRVQALNAWLMWEAKNESQQQAVISGLTLGNLARQEYAPILQAKLREMDASMGRVQ